MTSATIRKNTCISRSSIRITGRPARAERGERDAEEEREEHDLQDVALRRTRRPRSTGTMWVRKSTKRSSFPCAANWPRRRPRRAVRASMPSPGPEHVHHHQPDAERERRHDLEVDERLEPHPPDPLEVGRVRHAADDGEEDDRRDDHPHQVDEGVAQGLHGPAGRRPERADQRAQRDGHQHADGQVAAEAGQPGRCHEVRRS